MRCLIVASIVLVTAHCGLDVVGVTSPDAGVDAGVDAAVVADDAADIDARAPFAFPASDCPPGQTFDDDFTTDPSTRWTQVSGTWTWDSTAHTYSTTAPSTLAAPPYSLAWLGPRPLWRNYTVQMVFTATQNPGTDHGDYGPAFRIGSVGTGSPPVNNAGTFYVLDFETETGSDLALGSMANDNYAGLNQGSPDPRADSTKPVTVQVDVTDGMIQASLNGTRVFTQTDTTYDSGSIGLRTYQGAMTVTHVILTCH